MRFRTCIAVLALATSLGAMAQKKATFGDWDFGIDDFGLPYMATVNDSDGMMGRWCDGETEKCFWLMAIRLRCDVGAEFPALLSSSAGATATRLVCGGPYAIGRLTYHRLIITDFELMNRLAAEGNGRIGIVIATDAGDFRVNRFSLRGAQTALSRMEHAESEYVRAKQQRSTRDRTL